MSYISMTDMRATLLIISFILLVGCTLGDEGKDARPDYWKRIMKDKPMPDGIKTLLTHDGSIGSQPSKYKRVHFANDFEETSIFIAEPKHTNSKALDKDVHFPRDFEETAILIAEPKHANSKALDKNVHFARDFDETAIFIAEPKHANSKSLDKNVHFARDFEETTIFIAEPKKGSSSEPKSLGRKGQ